MVRTGPIVQKSEIPKTMTSYCRLAKILFIAFDNIRNHFSCVSKENSGILLFKKIPKVLLDGFP